MSVAGPLTENHSDRFAGGFFSFSSDKATTHLLCQYRMFAFLFYMIIQNLSGLAMRLKSALIVILTITVIRCVVSLSRAPRIHMHVLEKSTDEVTIKEGGKVDLFVKYEYLDGNLNDHGRYRDGPNCNISWIKETLIIVEGAAVATRTQNTVMEAVRDGAVTAIHLEQLNIENATIKDSGSYSLYVITYHRGFDMVNVNVKSEQFTVSLIPPNFHRYRFLGPGFTNFGSRAVVVCRAQGLPHVKDIKLLYRKGLNSSKHPSYNRIESQSESWTPVSPKEYSIIKGTYETVIRYPLVVYEALEIRCEAERGSYKRSARKIVIRVADGTASISTIIKSPKAFLTTLEEPDPIALEGDDGKIYEGDYVKLSCAHDKEAPWDVVWINNRQDIPIGMIDISNIGVNRSVSFYEIYWTAGKQEYICRLTHKDSEETLEYEVTFEVHKVEPPRLIFWGKNDSDVNLAYGEPLKLSCPFTGAPAPQYTWYKDGIVYKNGFHQNGNFRNLYLPRVVCLPSSITTKTFLLFHILGGALLFIILICIVAFLIYCMKRKSSISRKRQGNQSGYTSSNIPDEEVMRITN